MPPEISKSNMETSVTEVQEELSPLSDRDFRIFNHMAVKMDYFHDKFRRSWNLLWLAATTKTCPQNMEPEKLIDVGLSFARNLTTHHNIEEAYFFPMLAEKMPEFQSNQAELLKQHRDIHAGLDGFVEYLQSCRRGETELDMIQLKAVMESWGDVLWTHLDQEVKTISAKNMRRYWTLDDMIRMQI
ncbi:hypothetical protein FOQG_10832 [Fusarium oxysporum f. sp. raphani 54005]|uniref:Hemerythrin-like domain-containing protein n=6 Tax=Fusarium oxysporum TaxID=5507 RepID=X0C1Z9_FUSOX|nr:hypothetical protein FOVG_03721 [Fusarium oxysporum f. sp. pisi HDV247]EXK85178.1 hypothetical protein FOQG_10832 [Fusarium oxysporum f. sp. raphani 54005]EXL69776.1 hypothetical protein FOPG_14305 [Fusarium oxysporum f. sp. conglutinans race 2 54008]KAF6526068.1 hypothetical protein HZS61_009112 [Fusarium oxysporum f. sp. conglutinans]KAJ4030517.1 hypothetical protein NW758_012895 [Fusarium oxysporum]